MPSLVTVKLREGDLTALCTHHLKQGKVGVAHVVKSDLGVDPGVVLVGTLPLVLDDGDGEPQVVLIEALVELAPEELDAHDGEDEPEHEAHQQHVEDGGDGVHESVHNNLHSVVR